MRATRRLLLGLFALLPCLAPTIAHAAWPHDPANGNVAVCTANADQLSPCIVPDGSGGTIIAWSDSRSGTSYDIYAQHLNAAGVPTWTSNGVAVCTAPGSQQPPRIVSDGAGGAILAWDDPRSGAWDTYAQRLNSAGVPQWTANGVAICTAAGDQINARLVADGSGGAILTWSDGRVAGTDIYAQRVNASGVPQWTTNGVGLCTAANSQTAPAIVSDAAGGAIVAWQDLRGGATYDIYAQRVDGAGTTLWAANGVPLCLSANDQGNVAMIPDGAGGAIAAWHDLRSGSPDDA